MKQVRDWLFLSAPNVKELLALIQTDMKHYGPLFDLDVLNLDYLPEKFTHMEPRLKNLGHFIVQSKFPDLLNNDLHMNTCHEHVEEKNNSTNKIIFCHDFENCLLKIIPKFEIV